MPPDVLTTGSRVSRDTRKTLLPETPSSECSSPLYRKLLLLSSLGGGEMCAAFQQLYEVPLLQILGFPIAYLSLYSLFTGPAAMILLNLLGRLSDKGLDHRKRKIVSAAFVSTLILLGCILLIMANLMLLSERREQATSAHTEKMTDVPNNRSVYRLSETVRNHIVGSEASTVADRNYTRMHEDKERGSLPLTAVLGLVGIAVIDTGYDVNVGTARACVLACSNSNDHTVLLLLALVLAALGGCFSNVLGLLDLSRVLDLGDAKGSLVAQTTVQLMINGLVVIICGTSTVVTAVINIRNIDNFPYRPVEDHKEETHHYQTFDTKETHGKTYKSETESGKKETNESSQDFDTSDESLDEDKDISERQLEEGFTGFCLQSACNSNPGTDHQDDNISDGSVAGDSSSVVSLDVLSSDIGTNSSDESNVQSWKCPGWNKLKINFIIAFVSAYLGASTLFTYNIYVSNFLGTVVTGGDSTAPHDSAEFKAYTYGVTFGAGGLLVVFCCYLAISIVHNKLLEFWGLKVEFCLSHAFMAASILSLVLSKHVAAFYVSSVTFGFQRAVLHSVPFIIASNYMREQEKAGISATGKMMAIMTCSIPLSNLTTFAISGSLINITQYAGAPLVLALVCSSLGCVLFLLMYRP